jgi:hypothetical protein
VVRGRYIWEICWEKRRTTPPPAALSH